MLVLSRKLNEEVVIDNRVRVRVIAIQGGRVRLGISAPKEVSINRSELLDGMTDEGQSPYRETEIEVPYRQLAVTA